jgi:hypothetical protein
MKHLFLIIFSILCAAADTDSSPSIRRLIGMSPGMYRVQTESQEDMCEPGPLEWSEVGGETSLQLGPKIVFHFETQKSVNRSSEDTGIDRPCNTTTQVFASAGEARRIENTKCRGGGTMEEVTILKKAGSGLVYRFERRVSAGLQAEFLASSLECTYKKANF